MYFFFCRKLLLPEEMLAIMGRTGCQATSSNNSPLVPCRIFTKFPIDFSHIYKACCLADPAQIYSPSPEKQHFFHIVLKKFVFKHMGRYMIVFFTYSLNLVTFGLVPARHLYHKLIPLYCRTRESLGRPCLSKNN